MSEKDKVRDNFFRFLKATSLKANAKREHLGFRHSYGHNNLLLGWDHAPFMDATKALKEVCPMVSEKTIKRVLTDSMVKLFEDHNVRQDADPQIDGQELDSIFPTLETDAILKAIAELRNLLQSQIKLWTTFVFIQGIKLRGLTELPLGTITLYDIDSGPLSQALKEQKAISQEKGYNWDYTEFIQRDTQGCKCYLTIDIEGESVYVDQSAFEQAQNVVNVLNLYIASCRHRENHMRINVMGRAVISGRRTSFKRNPPFSDGSPPLYTYSAQDSNFLEYIIEDENTKRWKENCLDKALEYVTSESEPGSAESRIHNAFTWYGRAIGTNSPDEQFVNLMIALESLLVAEEDVERIKQRLADEVAGLLGGNFQKRRTIKERIGELYAMRSNVVHKGIPISLERLYELDTAVTNTIIAFLRREME